MGVHNNSKTIRKKRIKKNKVLAEVESSEPCPSIDAVPKLKKVKTKKIHTKTITKPKEAPKNIDLEAIDRQIHNLKDTNETISKKSRKKVRQLEFLKKRFSQMKNTQESLKLADGDKTETLNCSDDEKNQPVVNEIVVDTSDNMDKIETMKGIKRFVVFVGNLPKSVTEDDVCKNDTTFL